MKRRLRLRGRHGIEGFLRVLVEEAASTALSDLDDDEMKLAGSSQQERERQQSVAQGIKDAIGGMSSSSKEHVKEDEDEEGSDSDKRDKKQSSDDDKKKAAEKEKKKNLPKHMHSDLPAAEDVSLDMIVDRIDVVRSGQSLDDEKVAVEMSHYFEGLSSPERLALLSFLTGIAQIVTAGVSGEKAPEPNDPEVGVDIIAKKAKEVEAEKEKNKRVSPKPSSKNSGNKSSGEDVTPPIQVGTRQATESIRRRVRELL